jgi:hypothetical protein
MIRTLILAAFVAVGVAAIIAGQIAERARWERSWRSACDDAGGRSPRESPMTCLLPAPPRFRTVPTLYYTVERADGSRQDRTTANGEQAHVEPGERIVQWGAACDVQEVRP